jgi:hypothetical protein
MMSDKVAGWRGQDMEESERQSLACKVEIARLRREVVPR